MSAAKPKGALSRRRTKTSLILKILRRATQPSVEELPVAMPAVAIPEIVDEMPSPWQASVSFGWTTEVGYLHRDNEDMATLAPDLFALVPCSGEYRGSEAARVSLFGVFDGHGGHHCSSWTKDNLHRHIAEQLWCRNFHATCGPILYQSFIAADQEYRKLHGSETSGSCATCVLVKDHRVYCANAGDSKAMIVVADSHGRPQITNLNQRHSANLKSERRRVLAAGGSIDLDGRINGILLPSRAIGDNDCKLDGKPVIIAAPDGTGLLEQAPHELSPDTTSHLILATDGLWDFVPDEDVARFLLDQAARPEADVAKSLFRKARSRGSADDVTIVIVRLALQPATVPV